MIIRIAVTAAERTVIVAALTAYGFPNLARTLAAVDPIDPAEDGPEVFILRSGDLYDEAAKGLGITRAEAKARFMGYAYTNGERVTTKAPALEAPYDLSAKEEIDPKGGLWSYAERFQKGQK